MKPSIRTMPRTTTGRLVEAALDKAMGPITVPKHLHLPAKALPYWADVIASRPRHSWTAAHLMLASQAARLMAELDALKGPIASTMKQRSVMIARLLSLLRALQVVGARVPRVPVVPEVDEDDEVAGLIKGYST